MPAQKNIGRDPQLWLALAAGPVCWLMLWWWSAATAALTWPLHDPTRFLLPALVYPLLEEIVFRGGMQPLLLRQPFFSRRWSGLSIANLVTSLAFAGLHLVAHTPLWAAAVFVPSLVFGYFRDRHDSVTSPIVLHVFYNAGYFWLFGR
jgi:hypothetical protein